MLRSWFSFTSAEHVQIENQAPLEVLDLRDAPSFYNNYFKLFSFIFISFYLLSEFCICISIQNKTIISNFNINLIKNNENHR